MDLPKKFKVRNTQTSGKYPEYDIEFDYTDCKYIVHFQRDDGSKASVTYSQSTLSGNIDSGVWKIISTEAETLLEQIQSFAINTGSDVIIDKQGYAIQYRDLDPVRAKDDEELLKLMKLITDFDDVFKGK